jgi:hypothetical protein
MKFNGMTYRHLANAIATYMADLRMATLNAERIARRKPTQDSLAQVKYWNDALQEADDLIRVAGAKIGEDMGRDARIEFNTLVVRLTNQRESDLLKILEDSNAC